MHAEPLTWRRLAAPATTAAMLLAVLAAIGETVATVIAGRLADGPSVALVVVLAVLLLGGTALDLIGRLVFVGPLGRAEQRLRADLFDAAVHQPLPALEEQAVGELLDRVDDDPRQVGQLLRRAGWELGRAVLRSVLAWLVAGFTWWPAWIAFPLIAAAAWFVARPLTSRVAQAKEAEEQAWSDHSAQLEEAIAGRDDVRSSLGQPHVVRQYAVRGAEVLRRARRTVNLSATVSLRTGLVLCSLLSALALVGVGLVSGGALGLGELITLWLLVTTFVGQLDRVSNNLPDLQSGLGALSRIRTLLHTDREPDAGAALPTGPVEIRFTDLTAGYPGGFALRGIDLVVPAGTTCALVGRTGAGKSTLAKLLSRAIEPPPGTVFVADRDITAIDLTALRRGVGVVTQRTEILTATIADNITLFADVAPGAVDAAIDALDLRTWVDSLPDGVHTRLGTGGTTLSAGEEQLVAFARLLVRDVSVVVLDEATARMDPQTEQLVTRAGARLLAGRTGLLVAHRLSTTRHCDTVAVLDAGRVIQHGPRAELAQQEGPFRDLLTASGPAEQGAEQHTEPAAGTTAPATAASATAPEATAPSASAPLAPSAPGERADTGLHRHRRTVARAAVAPVARPRLGRTVARLIVSNPRWGLLGGAAFALTSLVGGYGVLTGWLWGGVAAGLAAGTAPWAGAVALALAALAGPFALAAAFRTYLMWWADCTLRMRLAVLRGQTDQLRLRRTPPGEVVARALDSDRMMQYADFWVDAITGLLIVGLVAASSGSLLAASVVGGMLALSALVAGLGTGAAGRAGRASADARARFGTALVSALDAVRTIKLAAAVDGVRAHLAAVDRDRVAAYIREQRIRALLLGVPLLLVQAGVVLAWALYLAAVFDLATTLLLTTVLAGSAWFGAVWAALITEAPIARAWVQRVGALAGAADLIRPPVGVDLIGGTAPAPRPAGREPLRRLVLDQVSAVHDDGTVGVDAVDLAVDAGSLVLLTGRVGSGKSSLLASLAGLVDHQGSIRWNDREVSDPQLFLRPGQVAYVGQVPRVLSGTFTDNVTLDHPRTIDEAITASRMDRDVTDAGGPDAVVGNRGVRLSGGQVQRLALARALATGAELIVADDVSSALDATTERELWRALRGRGTTVVGASSKRAALAEADTVVVLEDGRVAEVGPWASLAPRWEHLAG